jgi:hypothetical protein
MIAPTPAYMLVWKHSEPAANRGDAGSARAVAGSDGIERKDGGQVGSEACSMASWTKERCRKEWPKWRNFVCASSESRKLGGDPDEKCFTLTRTAMEEDNGGLMLGAKRRSQMKALVASFVRLMFAALLTLVLATAQSNPAVHVNQANATRDAQTPPARMDAQPVPSAQMPPISFAKVASYNSGLSGGGNVFGNSVAIADLNGDGKPDLAVVEGDSMFSVLLGNGDGTFQAPVSYSSGGPYASSVAIADLNGDGKLDVVFAGNVAGRGGVVGVLLGNGDGTFQTPVSYSTGAWGNDSVAIADLNGDGYPDLVVASECLTDECSGDRSGAVSVLLGNGDGTFRAPANYGSGGWEASSVAIADLNGDGYPDLAVSNLCQLSANCPVEGAPPGEVSVLLGNGDGTFQTAVSYSSGGSWATSVAIGALSGGGDPDLVATNFFVPEDSVGVLLGNGNGTFQAPVSYAEASALPNSVAIADVNGDGYLDLVVASMCELNRSCGRPGYDGGVAVLLGNGDGTFQNSINYNSGGPDAVSVAVADVNGDGRPDLVALNLGSSTVGVLLNKTSYSTRTVLTSSPNPSLVNQTVTFRATITSTPPVPNGEVVTFHHGTTGLGTGTTTNGVATLTASLSKAVTYTTMATYSGDPFHKASSGTVKQMVALYPSTTTLSSSPNPSTSGQAVTLTATVSSGAAGGPTGTVIFKNGTTYLAMKPLSTGKAILTKSKLPVGTLRLGAYYSGDTQSGKSSGTTTQTVDAPSH